jgi:hypothetical protein
VTFTDQDDTCSFVIDVSDKFCYQTGVCLSCGQVIAHFSPTGQDPNQHATGVAVFDVTATSQD